MSSNQRHYMYSNSQLARSCKSLSMSNVAHSLNAFKVVIEPGAACPRLQPLHTPHTRSEVYLLRQALRTYSSRLSAKNILISSRGPHFVAPFPSLTFFSLFLVERMFCSWAALKKAGSRSYFTPARVQAVPVICAPVENHATALQVEATALLHLIPAEVDQELIAH